MNVRPKGWSITSVRIDNTNPDFPNSDAWRVTVKNPRGKTFSRKFYKGYGHNGSKPELFEFMGSLISDARAVEFVSLEGFANDYGYEMETATERKHVERIYKTCEGIAAKLETFLTPEEWKLFEDH